MLPVTDELRAALTGPSVTFGAGAELLAPDLTVVQDISDDLESCTTARNNFATIHGTVTGALTRELAWGTDLVRTFMTVDGFRVYTGVWSLTTPKRVYGRTPVTYQVEGFDRLYLLDREIGAGYSVAAGAGVLAAVRQAITDAGLTGVRIDGSAGDAVLPQARTWPLSGRGEAATWLQVVNTLLRQVNYRSLWVDRRGVFQAGPYARPASRPSQWVFDEDPTTTITSEGQVEVTDLWRTPNRWVFRQTNRSESAAAPVEGSGIYTVNNVDDGPTSQAQRGLVWPVTVDREAASQAALVSLGDRRVAADLRRSAEWQISTSPLPIAGHVDMATLIVEGVSHRLQAHEWSLPHDGSDMTWKWNEVIG